MHPVAFFDQLIQHRLGVDTRAWPDHPAPLGDVERALCEVAAQVRAYLVPLYQGGVS